MSKDLAQVIFRGRGPFTVSREELAKNMQNRQKMAEGQGLRPGQLKVGEYFPQDEKISSDLLATGKTILSKPRKPA